MTERRRVPLAETDGLVRSPMPTPMLQPWEVYDQDLFDTEMVRVFGRSWVWLGDMADLQQPGDYVTATIGAQPIVVVRTASGEIKGYLNNCRHRASTVVVEPMGNCGSSMVCPYHNWAYNLDGDLIGIPDRVRMYPDGIPIEEYGLVPIRVEVAWDKLVFGCLSHKAPTFREWIAPIAERYDRYRFDTFERYPRQLDQVYPINWKAFVENSNDDYHVRFVHRRINSQRKSVRHAGPLRRPHVQRVQATPRFVRHGRRSHRHGRGRPGRPLRRLHLPQPHAAAVRDHADPGARRPAGPRPDAAGVTHLRPGSRRPTSKRPTCNSSS